MGPRRVPYYSQKARAEKILRITELEEETQRQVRCTGRRHKGVVR